MRDPIINEAIAVLREHQANLRGAGKVSEADAGYGYIERLQQRFPIDSRPPAPLIERRRK